MPVSPNPEAVLTVTQIMVKTLDVLHKVIEIEHKHPKEAMVLMMAFITGTTIQLKDKIETLEPGLGKQLLEAVNATLNPAGIDAIEKLNKNDPSLKKSVSGIAPDDLPAAVNFLSEQLLCGVKKHFDELPLLLRNETTLLHSLSVLVARLFNQLDNKNLENYIESFSNNIRIFASKGEQNSSCGQIYN